MKNVHLLPTDKPSRLFIDIDDNKLKITVPIGGEHMMNQNIYISSEEEIREGDWIIDLDAKRIVKANSLRVTTSKASQCWYYKKIILTTDQDLINDGVQPIDDKFLEWFVKNPSCEWVNVDTRPKVSSPYEKGFVIDNPNYNKITIPKETQKQHLIDIMKGDEELGLYDEPKQDTVLEKATEIGSFAEKKYLERIDNFQNVDFKDGVFEGAKWQSEQYNTSKVNRVEVIQHSPPYNGRAFTKYNAKDVEMQFQDDGRTLKIFLK